MWRNADAVVPCVALIAHGVRYIPGRIMLRSALYLHAALVPTLSPVRRAQHSEREPLKVCADGIHDLGLTLARCQRRGVHQFLINIVDSRSGHHQVRPLYAAVEDAVKPRPNIRPVSADCHGLIWADSEAEVSAVWKPFSLLP